eukprot:m.38783 g.38783  ORF g.38783 m.38783 type:complete len:449 (-) comp14673_c0_seq2:775-2121(-)
MGKRTAKVAPEIIEQNSAVKENVEKHNADSGEHLDEGFENDTRMQEEVLRNEATGFNARLLYLSQFADSVIKNLFIHLGDAIQKHTWWFIVVPLALGIACSTGLSRVEIQWNAEALYTPKDAPSFNDRNSADEVFSVATRIATIYSVGNPEGTNMLTAASLTAWYDVWSNITTFKFRYNGTIQSLDNICIAARDGRCQFTTIFAFWNYNRSVIASLSDSELNQTIVDAEYKAVELSGTTTTFDSIARLDANGNTISMRMQFFLAEELESIDGEGDNDPEIVEWERELTSMLQSTDWGPITVVSLTQWTVDLDDIHLLAFGYILLIFYATFVLSRNSSVHSHGSLALVSFISSGTATAACFGLGIYLGLEFSTIIETLAFLLLGLGMDDTFVLVSFCYTVGACAIGTGTRGSCHHCDVMHRPCSLSRGSIHQHSRCAGLLPQRCHRSNV